MSDSRKGTAYFSSSCRPHSLKDNYNIRSRMKMVYASSYLLSCCTAIAEVPIVAMGVEFIADFGAMMR